MNEELNLTFTLNAEQAGRAMVIACRNAGHETEDCTDPQACVMSYATMMLAKHVEMTERQFAEEAARMSVTPFFERAPITLPGMPT